MQDFRPTFAACHTGDLWSETRLEAQIRSDEIDILVDLSGRMACNRLPVFAVNPAPLQVSWLGYFATAGLPQMDAILADQVCVPADEASMYVEHVVRLPHTRLCMSPPGVTEAPAAPPMLTNGFITFGCFQTLPKINAGVPTLTLALPGMLGRQGQFMLENVGLRDWVTHSEVGYVQQAVAWGQDGKEVCEKLQGLRGTLRSQAAQSPLFDSARFARDWWATLQGIWRASMKSLAA